MYFVKLPFKKGEGYFETLEEAIEWAKENEDDMGCVDIYEFDGNTDCTTYEEVEGWRFPKGKEFDILKEIYMKLHEGYKYGIYENDMKYPFFNIVLLQYENRGKDYIGWRYYGSPAHEDTLEGLRWILDMMFKMKPSEFVQKYEARLE